MNRPVTARSWQCDPQHWHAGLAPNTHAQLASLQAEAAQAQTRYEALLNAQPLFTSYSAATASEVQAACETMRAQADHLVVVGTGGASLAAQTFCALAENPDCVSFLENCDPQTMAQLFARLNPARTAWLIISKSGETTETLAAALALEHWACGHSDDWAGRVYVITSDGARPLRSWAQAHAIPTLTHPSDLGGRFCAFSIVGLLPAAFAGLDAAALAAAAAAPMDQKGLHKAAALFAASLPAQPIHVVMGYADRLRPYTQWYKQLWAESLGKEGRGPTPMTAIGAIDQHSQLQLYLGGPRDKCFTLLLPDAQAETTIAFAATDIEELRYLNGHGLSDVMRETAEATCATLAQHEVPLRVFRGALSAQNLAQMMAQTIHETLMVAAYLDIDPFSQPAVESGKLRTRKALAS